MRIEQSRENVFTVTATSQELTALVAGARMALEAMRAAPEPPPREATEILERAQGEFNRAREHLVDRETGGGRPPALPGPAAVALGQAGAAAAVCSRMWAVIWSNSAVKAL